MEIKERGARLEEFVRDQWHGSMQSLADRADLSVQAMYKWFRGDGEPSVALLRSLARALGVPQYQLVAVYEGEDVQLPQIEIPASGGRLVRISVVPDPIGS